MEAFVRDGDLHLARGVFAFGLFVDGSNSLPALPLPLKFFAALNRLQRLNEMLPVDRPGIADLRAGEAGHQDACPPVLHLEETFERLPVDVSDVFQGHGDRLRLRKSQKPGGLGRHEEFLLLLYVRTGSGTMQFAPALEPGLAEI